MPKRRRRRLLRAGALLVLLVAGLGLAGACTATVRAPAGPIDDAVTVVVVRDALHSGVAFPTNEGFVEHGFGEWAWYAEGRSAWYRVFPTVLWPTTGAWSRRTVSATSFAELEQRWHWMRLAAVQVDAARARALRDRLDDRWFASPGPRLENGAGRLSFVHADAGYWFGFNCHDAVAAWMEELGCDVTWSPIRTGLEVATPARR